MLCQYPIHLATSRVPNGLETIDRSVEDSCNALAHESSGSTEFSVSVVVCLKKSSNLNAGLFCSDLVVCDDACFSKDANH